MLLELDANAHNTPKIPARKSGNFFGKTNLPAILLLKMKFK